MSIVAITIQRELYSLEAIQKAFYIFKRHHVSEITIVDDDTVKLSFKFPLEINDEDRAKILTAFNHELVDQSLREKIGKETEFVRNLILANAFSNAPIGE